jgi:membrane-bound inhibitor of C-type lysozyme
MLRPSALILVLATLSACDARREERTPPPSPLPAPAAGPPRAAAGPPVAEVFYQCADGTTIRARYPDTDTAVIETGGKVHTLEVARSGSGARYTGDGLQWWTKGLADGTLASLAAGEDIASASGVACKAPSPIAPVEPPAPGTPGGLPDDRTPISEAPFTPESAQGAANVLQTYFALVGEGKYGEAWRLWGDGGKASGMTEQAFADSFKKYGQYHGQVGAPGRIEGAAGSSYVEVVAQAYGRLQSGEPFVLLGPITLRRVNGVPGATPEQLQWRIQSSGMKPVPQR